MPGIVIFQRRWSVGSDDLVVPGLFLFIIHIVWWVSLSIQHCKISSFPISCLLYQSIRLIVLSTIPIIFDFDKTQKCVELLWFFIIFYICLLAGESTCQITKLLINIWLSHRLLVLSVNELCMCIVSMRGSILETSKRSSMQYWLYLRLRKKVLSFNNFIMTLFLLHSFNVVRLWCSHHDHRMV